MVRKAILNRVLVVILHVSGWAILFSIPFVFFSRPVAVMFSNPDRSFSISSDSVDHLPRPQSFGYGGTPSPDSVTHYMPRFGREIRIDPKFIIIETIATNLSLVIFFYLNGYFLIPRLLSRKGWRWYAPSVVVAFFLYLLIGFTIRFFTHPEAARFLPPFFMGSVNFVFILSLSLAFRLVQDKNQLDQEKKELENEQLKSELSFLRSQVSPHFMFNVLNSLASLARKKSDKLETVIIQLSQLMRYSLYQNGDRKVSIENEVHYLENYINLQKLRYAELAQIEFKTNLENKELLVEPMLLIPFVENAFKHGIGVAGEPIIMVILSVTDSQLHFTVRNKFSATPGQTKDPSSGIGLQNVRRRLNLLYKEMHALDTYKTADGWFVAELKLILQ